MDFKKIIGKSAALLVLSAYFVTSASAAESTESLKKDAAEQLTILQEKQDQKQELEQQIETAANELQGIQSSIASLETEIKEVEAQIVEVKEKINENKDGIVALEESMYARQSLIEERLVAMQQNSKDNVFIDILLNSESIVDMIQKAHSVFVLFGADRDILDTQQADLNQLEEMKAEIEKNEQTLEIRQQELASKEANLGALEESQKSALQEVQSKYDTVSSEIELTMAEQTKIEAKIVALETAAKEAALVQAAAEAEKAKAIAVEAKAEAKVTTEEVVKVEKTEANDSKVKAEETAKTESTNSSSSSSQSESKESSQEGSVIYVTSTAYTPAESTTGKTATGFDVWANPNARIIAVDPSVIPLGTKVWVEGYGNAIAADTGGAIVGYKIDVLLPTVGEALNWGRRTVKVIIQS